MSTLWHCCLNVAQNKARKQLTCIYKVPSNPSFYQNLWGLLQDSYYICEVFSSTHIKCRLDTWLVCHNSLNSLQPHMSILYTAITLQHIWKEIINNMVRWKVLQSKTKPLDCVFFSCCCLLNNMLLDLMALHHLVLSISG